jgi:hypothetical protein
VTGIVSFVVGALVGAAVTGGVAAFRRDPFGTLRRLHDCGEDNERLRADNARMAADLAQFDGRADQ